MSHGRSFSTTYCGGIDAMETLLAEAASYSTSNVRSSIQSSESTKNSHSLVLFLRDHSMPTFRAMLNPAFF